MSISKVLVANRGEIALRIIRACKELDIKTVAIYSEADEDSMHVTMADEAYCIGPALSSKSYLSIPTIISTALTCGADAIHPGYGFLAENAHFVDVCNEHNIKFIGPSSDAINKMGDKATARETVMAAGVPVVPGSDGLVESIEDAIEIVESKIKYPVIIKATAGGGGRGMRVCKDRAELEKNFVQAQTEAKNAFGNAGVYIEKFITQMKHIEVQVFADAAGNCVHMAERDCSVQRRHQKLVEEAPSPVVDEDLRQRMGEDAVKAAKAVNYEGAGTIEYIFVPDTQDYYFIEMNTRIQVEHCVTEMITGFDLVQWQLRVANGENFDFTQDDVSINGHSIECRINAEDPGRNFMPCPGHLTGFMPPGGLGVRVDTHCYTDYFMPPNYDSLMGKLIVWGRNREQAIKRMQRCLDEFTITGIQSTIPFHKEVMANKVFQSGDVCTDFIEKHMPIPVLNN
ncbi:MAG: acetyl-CoA carboxylase biotin carboxylase subunit [Candidatus Melainabacteria bacterium]|nr:acetyl-CoA carboxylase biotin carboxylase subunit [Candidatus Melainabacteria bacterium]